MAARLRARGRDLRAAYRIEVYWRAEDDRLDRRRARLALLHGGAHGPAPHDAVAEVEGAMEAWLEAARSDGRAGPEPPSRIADS